MQHRLLSAPLLLLVAVLGACATVTSLPRPGGFVSREVTMGGVSRSYQVFVPTRKGGGAHPAVILFLHGSGERGSEGIKQTQAGLGPYVRDHAATFPAIVVFPQVPENEEWSGPGADVAFAALDAATAEFSGDTSRIYLTGMSMGGYGTWELALRQPRRFAGLVPVCGAVRQISSKRSLSVTTVENAPDPYAAIATRLRDVPVWIFHGAKDDVVPLADDRALIRAFTDAGAVDARYTEFPDADHNAWDPAYARTPELWTWLFAQHR